MHTMGSSEGRLWVLSSCLNLINSQRCSWWIDGAGAWRERLRSTASLCVIHWNYLIIADRSTLLSHIT